MAPAIVLLAAVALVILGSLSHSAVSDPAAELVANASVRQDVSQLRGLATSGNCDLTNVFARRDRLSGGFVRIMFRMTEGLDRVTRDASQLVEWVERLLTTDGLGSFEVLLDGVVELFEPSLDPQSCLEKTEPAAVSGDHTGLDHAPCHA